MRDLNTRCKWLKGSILKGAQLVMLGILFSTAAQAADLANLPMKSLLTGDSRKISDFAQPVKIAMIFQPACGWCEKQAKVLDQLYASCPALVQPIFIGTRGDRASLRREITHYSAAKKTSKTSVPSLMASTEFLRALNGVKGTPVNLFFDGSNRLLGTKRGFIQQDLLQKVVSQQSGQLCG